MSLPCTENGKLFYKTRLCEKYREGTCPYDPNCKFAHGIEDLRRPPPNWQEIVGTQVDDDLKIITRHKLCKTFCNGEVCPYGERCIYHHEDPGKYKEESRLFRESSVISISTAGTSLDNEARSNHSDAINTAQSNVDTNWVNSKPVSWKTRMCNKWWETSGNCPFGDQCNFAHGLADGNSIGLPGDGTGLTKWRNRRDELALIDNDPKMQSFVETLVSDEGCHNLQGGKRGGRLVS
ncbi:Zinc finger ccch domain-containing protein [Thalictrum thalictroides]|uniref:Zinc finger ccch domain-containing protein n=1 Tax=Thalictrum thalictroides TaxID=46969 RepID=A0A7J6W3B3_THATH|nr:Zinc finger ccch domain-containing protein [Thalictrum thalictroides]